MKPTKVREKLEDKPLIQRVGIYLLSLILLPFIAVYLLVTNIPEILSAVFSFLLRVAKITLKIIAKSVIFMRLHVLLPLYSHLSKSNTQIYRKFLLPTLLLMLSTIKSIAQQTKQFLKKSSSIVSTLLLKYLLTPLANFLEKLLDLFIIYLLCPLKNALSASSKFIFNHLKSLVTFTFKVIRSCITRAINSIKTNSINLYQQLKSTEKQIQSKIDSLLSQFDISFEYAFTCLPELFYKFVILKFCDLIFVPLFQLVFYISRIIIVKNPNSFLAFLHSNLTKETSRVMYQLVESLPLNGMGTIQGIYSNRIGYVRKVAKSF